MKTESAKISCLERLFDTLTDVTMNTITDKKSGVDIGRERELRRMEFQSLGADGDASVQSHDEMEEGKYIAAHAASAKMRRLS